MNNETNEYPYDNLFRSYQRKKKEIYQMIQMCICLLCGIGLLILRAIFSYQIVNRDYIYMYKTEQSLKDIHSSVY